MRREEKGVIVTRTRNNDTLRNTRQWFWVILRGGSDFTFFMYRDTTVLALIPARGGSKGVPKKNIRILGGIPLIAHSIVVAKDSPYIDRIVVSTDDPEIAAVARQYGAEVPFTRPKELAEDLTPDFPVFEHCLKWLEETEGYRPDLVVHLRPTGALRTVKQVNESIQLLAAHPEADSVRSVHEPDKTPYKMWKPEGEYMVPFLKGTGIAEHYNAPRQLLPKVWATNANIGVMWYRTLVQKKSVIGDVVLPYVVTELHVDFDSEFDFEIAELILRKRGQKPFSYS